MGVAYLWFRFARTKKLIGARFQAWNNRRTIFDDDLGPRTKNCSYWSEHWAQKLEEALKKKVNQNIMTPLHTFIRSCFLILGPYDYRFSSSIIRTLSAIPDNEVGNKNNEITNIFNKPK